MAGLRGPLLTVFPGAPCLLLLLALLSPDSSPSQAWDKKGLHALKWRVEFGPTSWSVSHQPSHGTQNTLIQLTKCPLPPESRERPWPPQGVQGGGCLCLETLSGKEEFTDFCLPKKRGP